MIGKALLKWAVVLFSILFLTGACWSSENEKFTEAQGLVDRTVAKYPDIVRLTIHAVPTGEKDSRIIACNIKEKIGKPSDPEDLEAMKTHKVVVLREGNNLDVTAPILDMTGKAIAATGITLRFQVETSEAQLTERAKAIAGELTLAIQNAGKRLW